MVKSNFDQSQNWFHPIVPTNPCYNGLETLFRKDSHRSTVAAASCFHFLALLLLLLHICTARTVNNKKEKDFAPWSQEMLSNQFHQINFNLSSSFSQFHQINFIFSISSNQFYPINLIKLILSNQFYQSNFISFILSISFYQFHFTNFILSISFLSISSQKIILYTLELIWSKYSKFSHSVNDDDPPFF